MRETERFSPRYRDLDLWSDEDVLAALLEAQLSAVASVRPALAAIAAAARAMAERLARDGSRLVYAGAGASGALAVQDGMEMPQTFGWPAERLVLLVAGGDEARLSPLGVAEDDAAAGREAIDGLGLDADDVVIVVAASGTTPYSVAVLEAARTRGALTVAVANTPSSALLAGAHHAILAESGPEVIAGSTRMNAGTAQKVVLGLLSTLTMTRLHRVVDGLMVALVADNEKLAVRAARIVSEVAGVGEAEAVRALDAVGGVVKSAVLVALGASPERAEVVLARAGGDLRAAMAEVGPRAGGRRVHGR